MKPPVRRLYPHRLHNPLLLSRLLELYLKALADSPLHVETKALSFDSGIPENIIHRLERLHYEPADAPNIEPRDYHILFANLLFRYPTVKFWDAGNGNIYIEM